MKTFHSDSYQSAAPAGRPSLYGAHEKPQMGEDAFSILGRLEPNRKKRNTAWRIAWTTPLLSLAAIGVVLGLNGGFPNVPMPASGATATYGNLARPHSAAVGQPLADTPAEVAGSTQGAMIAAEPPPVQDGGQSGELSMLSVDTQRGTAVAQAAYEALPAVVMAAGAVTTGNSPEEPPASVAPQRANAHPGQSRPAAKKPYGTSTRKGAKDKDVELIGALLAHVSAPAAAPPKVPSRKPPAASAARRVRNAPARESVRQAGDISIDAQVKRCRQLGFFEGEMCRLRVCSDLWGKNPACPASTPAASDS